MDHPKNQPDNSEYTLDANEIADLDFLMDARKVAADIGNIVMNTETITKDEKYGYIFRYDIVDFVENDGSFHPEDGMKGMIHKITTRVVVSSRDGKEYLVVTSII
jgi:hypothetical protein